MLIAHMLEAFEHECQEAKLCFIRRRIATMAAFGGVSHVTGSLPGQERFAQPSPRRDDADGAPRDWRSDIDGVHVVGPQARDGKCDGLEIVHQMDGFQFEFFCDHRLVNYPRQIGDFRATVHYWSGDGKAGSVDRYLDLRQKLPGNSRQAAIIGAMHFCLGYRRVGPGLSGVNRQNVFWYRQRRPPVALRLLSSGSRHFPTCFPEVKACNSHVHFHSQKSALHHFERCLWFAAIWFHSLPVSWL